MMKLILMILIVLIAVSITSIFAEEIPFGVPEQEKELDSTGSPDFFVARTFLTLIVSLIVIIILIYFTLYIFKKISHHGRLVTNIDKNAKILDIFPLNAKQSIYLVRLCDIIYLLAISGDNVQLIDKISEPDKIDRLLENATKGNEHSFKSFFTKFKK